MQIESIKMFCDAAAERSFSKAAAENGVTQPMVSQAVNSIEKHFDLSLIDRSRRPWNLTEEGKIFFDGAREIVERFLALENALGGRNHKMHSIVRVGAIYSVVLCGMDKYIEAFRYLKPGVEVHIEYLHPDRVYKEVLDEKIDFGIVSFPRASRELAVIPWRKEKMVLVSRPGSPFSDKESVDPASLDGVRFTGFDRGLVIRREVDKFLKKFNASVGVDPEFDNIEAIKRSVENSDRISILPEPSLETEIREKRLCKTKLGNSEFYRPLGIIYRKNKKITGNTLSFIDTLEEND
ncbi:MAG: LysR family transcriptional regulator [Fibrobacterota bacterium]